MSTILVLFLASCARPAPVATPTAAIATPASASPTASATAQAPHAAEIRFALVGNVTSPNVWALFDAKGYSYNNYAVRAAYWPRLYRLTIPDGGFEPQAAAGTPTPIQPEGGFWTATVPLRPDLKWTDGSPFTAQDVAFTVDTAVAFQLGFDWHAYYDPSYLDHAEALDAHTVKFFFKKAPDVAVWQYGALQGPIVQKAYWAPKLTDAASLLPTANQLAQIDTLETQVASVQKGINDLVVRGSTASGEEARQLQTELRNQQNNLDGLRNAVAKAHDAVDGDMDSARQSLYAVDASGEPTLGTWLPAGESNGTWTNSANPAHPFASPNFDRAVYITYPDEASAAAALKEGQVNAILEPNGISPVLAAQGMEGARSIANPNSSVHFLAFNPHQFALADPLLRRILFCAMDRPSLAHASAGMALGSFVPQENTAWSHAQANISCGEGYGAGAGLDASRSIDALKAAGYTWTVEPVPQGAGIGSGSGLRLPGGMPVPAITLLRPLPGTDLTGAQAADFVVDTARFFGITMQPVAASAADIRYALFNNHHYDMALVGWRLSTYPGYLCDWFGDGNPFGYNIPQVRADCATLSTTTDLEKARQLLFDIQSVLSQDPPFIPLFSGVTYDSTREIVYPFDHVLNGLSGVYGAPELAIPVP